MAQVRLLTGRFLALDGFAIQDFEDSDIPVGDTTQIPVTVGTNGCELMLGNFLQR